MVIIQYPNTVGVPYFNSYQNNVIKNNTDICNNNIAENLTGHRISCNACAYFCYWQRQKEEEKVFIGKKNRTATNSNFNTL